MPSWRVSRKAQQDILEIGRYTQDQWGSDQRRNYLSGLAECFERLAETPAMAAERREYDPPVRIHRYGNHLVVYLADRDGIFVIRLLHESMDVPSRLSGE
jgi:toxin ParE1/3/4